MAATYTQAGRPMAVTTALGEDAVLLEKLHGTEGLSELFSYDLDLLVTPENSVDFAAVVGQAATVRLSSRTGQERFVNGILCRFGQAGIVRGVNGDHTFTRYTCTLVPTLWKLTKTSRSRIFQQKTVPEILDIVLADVEFEQRLTGTYEPRDYCSQYQESDFAFASRLMEEEGIFYYFKHEDGSHTMILGDAEGAHESIPGDPALIYDDQSSSGQNLPEDRIRGWSKSQELQSGKVTMRDHCFELPSQDLEVDEPTQGDVTVGAVSHSLAVGGNDGFEVYAYPGRYAQRFDGIDPSGGDRAGDVGKIKPDGKRTVKLAMQQQAAGAIAIQADGAVRGITAGHTFSLQRHGDGDGDYLVRRVEVWGDLRASYHNRESDGSEEFVNSFAVMPAGLPFRPPAVTPKGRIHGVQAGTVVGPAGEEIFTDKYSRVKVQFRWDRDGGMDADSSCWVRVGSMWAGKQWGMIHIPRIGQEVLIAFEEGDPDRPIVVGSVYNAEQMPPYTLPDNRTQSGIKSRSSLKGTPDNFNELRFEDKKGEEQVYFHAEKDRDDVVENNMTLNVGFREGGNQPEDGDRTVAIFNNQSTTIGKPHPNGTNPYDGSQALAVWNNRDVIVGNGKARAADGSETVSIWNDQKTDIGTGKGRNQDGSQAITIWNNQTLDIGTGKGQSKNGDQTVTVWNDQTLTVGSGKGANPAGTQKVTIWKDRQVAIKTGNDKLVIDKGNQNTTLKTGNRDVQIEVGNDVLVIKTGNRTTSIKLGKDKTEAMQSITLKVGSSKLVIDPTGISLDAAQVKINGKMTTVSGMMVDVKANGILSMGGALTKIG